MIVKFINGYKLKQIKAKKVSNSGEKYVIITEDNSDIVVDSELVHYIIDETYAYEE